MRVEMIPMLLGALFYLSTLVLLHWLFCGILNVVDTKAENLSHLEIIVLAEMLKLLPLVIDNNKKLQYFCINMWELL